MTGCGAFSAKSVEPVVHEIIILEKSGVDDLLIIRGEKCIIGFGENQRYLVIRSLGL